jgi:hypothetical protein
VVGNAFRSPLAEVPPHIAPPPWALWVVRPTKIGGQYLLRPSMLADMYRDRIRRKIWSIDIVGAR